MLIPLKIAFPNFRLQDFLPRGAQMCAEMAKQLQVDVETSLVDLSVPCEASEFSEEADPADKQVVAVKNSTVLCR